MTLADDIRSCTACPLQETRTLATPASVGENYCNGGLAFLAGFPRALEDKAGSPMVEGAQRYGIPVGVLFNQLLQMAGVNRADVLVMNRVRCKPPRNRVGDYPEATANCDQWNVAEFTEYNPRLVVLLGATTLNAVFGAKARVSQSRGVYRATSDKFVWGARLWTATFDPAAISAEPALMLEIANDIRQAAEMRRTQ